MHPKAISDLIAECGFLKSKPGAEVPFFLSSWTAWEATRTRFLRVVIARLGWLVKDADDVLGELRISSTSRAEEVFYGLKVDRKCWPIASQEIWDLLASVEKLRNQLTHGFRAYPPDVVFQAGALAYCSVVQPAWLEETECLDSEGHFVEVGCLNRRQSGRRADKTKSADSLKSFLRANGVQFRRVPPAPVKVPTRPALERGLKLFS